MAVGPLLDHCSLRVTSPMGKYSWCRISGKCMDNRRWYSWIRVAAGWRWLPHIQGEYGCLPTAIRGWPVVVEFAGVLKILEKPLLDRRAGTSCYKCILSCCIPGCLSRWSTKYGPRNTCVITVSVEPEIFAGNLQYITTLKNPSKTMFRLKGQSHPLIDTPSEARTIPETTQAVKGTV